MFVDLNTTRFTVDVVQIETDVICNSVVVFEVLQNLQMIKDKTIQIHCCWAILKLNKSSQSVQMLKIIQTLLRRVLRKPKKPTDRRNKGKSIPVQFCANKINVGLKTVLR